MDYAERLSGHLQLLPIQTGPASAIQPHFDRQEGLATRYDGQKLHSYPVGVPVAGGVSPVIWAAVVSPSDEAMDPGLPCACPDHQHGYGTHLPRGCY